MGMVETIQKKIQRKKKKGQEWKPVHSHAQKSDRQKEKGPAKETEKLQRGRKRMCLMKLEKKMPNKVCQTLLGNRIS